jgi:hypothetical protein
MLKKDPAKLIKKPSTDTIHSSNHLSHINHKYLPDVLNTDVKCERCSRRNRAAQLGMRYQLYLLNQLLKNAEGKSDLLNETIPV